MVKDSEILMHMAKSLLNKHDVPAHILHGRDVGYSGYAVCRAASHLHEQDHGKAALAALRAGFVPIPICTRFQKPTVDIKTWRDALSTRCVRQHWQRYPRDEVGFMLEPTDSAIDAEECGS